MAAMIWQTMSAGQRAPFEAEAALAAALLNSDRRQDLGGGLGMTTEWLEDEFFLIRISPRQN